MGIDPDLEHLQIAKEKYQASNLEYMEGRGENIPGGDYDVVFSNFVLHWCPDKNLIFKQVAKCLKNGGKFGFIISGDFDIVSEMFLPEDLFSPECRQYCLTLLHLLPTNELLSLLIKNNFTLKFFKEYYREWRFADVHKLIEFYMIHMKGVFDKTHFNIEVFKKRYGEGEIVFKLPYLMIIAAVDKP